MSEREYKVVVYKEGLLGSVVFGQGKVDAENFSDFLNRHAADGWRVVALERESRRTLLFWEREAFMVVLEREHR